VLVVLALDELEELVFEDEDDEEGNSPGKEITVNWNVLL
jgi:hypothetical protein